MSASALKRACLLAGGLAAAVALVVSPASAAVGTQHRTPPGSTAVQEYYWGWSDSRQYLPRTFVQTQYADPASLPRLVVTVVPAVPSRLVYLEYRQDGEWSTEAIMRTNSAGVAAMPIDPYCANNTWCDGTYTYRLRIGSITAPVSISYFEH